MLNRACVPGINPIGHGIIILILCYWFGLLLFIRDSGLYIFFLVMSLSDFFLVDVIMLVLWNELRSVPSYTIFERV